MSSKARVSRCAARCSPGWVPASPRWSRRAAKTSALQRARLGFVLGDLNVDNLGVARTQIAEFIAYSTGIARIIEPLLPLVIGRVSSDGPAVCSRKRWLVRAGTGSDRDTLAAAARAPAQRLHARSSIIPWPDYSAPVSFLAPTRRSVTNQRWNFRKRLEEQRRGAQCPTALRFDPEPMKRSPAGMPAGIRGDRAGIQSPWGTAGEAVGEY